MKMAFVVLIMLLPILAFTQPPDTLWTRTLDNGNGDDMAYSVQQTTDGGYIVAGSTGCLDAYKFYLVKTDSSGDTLWTRTYGYDCDNVAYSVQQTADGGYIVAGYASSVYSNNDIYLVKTDGAGSPVWTRYLGGGSYDEGQSVRQTADGGYIVAGITASFGAGELDFYLVKTDCAGNARWMRTYGGSDYDEAYSVQQTADGGYIVAGNTASFGAGQNDFYLVKTDTAGNALWTRTYGGSAQDLASSVQQTTDGGYVVVGTTTSFGAGGCDIYLVKTNDSGDTLWTRTYGGSWDEWGYSVQQTADGGYVIFGTNGDFYLVKTDGAGHALWTGTYGEIDRGEDGRSGQQTTDGGYIMAGTICSYEMGPDFYLVKTQPEGGPPCPTGYVTLISPGPPDWGYRLHRTSGALSRLIFTNFCSGTVGSVSGGARAAGWAPRNYADSIVFVTSTPLTSGTIDTFWLSHPYCSDYVTWTAGDSSGTIEGPLPVELTTFEAFAGDEQVMLHWRTESELDNSHFVLQKRKAGEEIFRKLTEIPGHGTTTEPHDYDYVDRWVQNGLSYDYRISDVDMTGRETIHEQIVSATPSAAAIPTEFALHASYPNPFNPTTTIRYDVKETGLVSLKVFDLLGREVATLVHGTVPAGSYSIDWDATDLPSGLYLCRMEAGQFMQVRKLVLLK